MLGSIPLIFLLPFNSSSLFVHSIESGEVLKTKNPDQSNRRIDPGFLVPSSGQQNTLILRKLPRNVCGLKS
jgi:hypothetical protein